MAFEPNANIYTAFFNELTLADRDRKELKTQRGFTDETITKLGFKTSCSENEKILQKLKEKFLDKDLFLCGITNDKGKLSWQFVKEDMIIIPYISRDAQQVYFYKSHKLGCLKGSTPMPYCDYIFENSPSKQVVLCESEFKAAAMWQMGYKALGLGGIATFAGQLIENLISKLVGMEEIVILFDNEIQDDESLGAFKKKWQSRYAQYIWSYKMARRLKNFAPDHVNYKIKIATLPIEWAVDGKIDIDTALAIGKTREDFEIIMINAVDADLYKDMMQVPMKHKPWVNRQIASALKTSALYSLNHCYWLKYDTKQGVKTAKLSNFIIHFKSTLKSKGEIYRDIQIESEYRDVSQVFTLKSEEIANFKSFKTKCLSQGDFLWSGNEAQWNTVIEELFIQNNMLEIELKDFVGRDDEERQWIFSNMILTDEGKELPLGADGKTFFDEDKAFRINSISSALLPSLSTEVMDIGEIVLQFQRAWGTNGLIGLTYAISSLFSDPIYENYQGFPILMIYGESKAGKSTLTDAMYFLLGYPANSTPRGIAESSIVGITRELNFYHSLPVRLDEFRNGDPKIESKMSTMRSIYNRQSASKGIRASFGIREVNVHGTLVLTGEEKPKDPAFQSRCIPVYISPHDKTIDSADAVKWIYNNRKKISYFTYWVLKKYAENASKLLTEMEETRIALQLRGGDNRTQNHYAMLLTVANMFLPKNFTAKLLNEFLGAFKTTNESLDQDSALNKFFYDVIAMRSMGINVDRYLARESGDNRGAAVYFQGLYNEWARFKQMHGGEKSAFTEQTLAAYLRSQPYCMKSGARRTMKAIDKSRVSCYILDLEHLKIPKEIKELFYENRNYAYVTNDDPVDTRESDEGDDLSSNFSG